MVGGSGPHDRKLRDRSIAQSSGEGHPLKQSAFNTVPACLDDEYAIANNFALILRNVGYAVTIAYDAESAVQIAELAPPELLITDFGLPGMNGVELALRIQKFIPECKIFFVTGRPE